MVSAGHLIYLSVRADPGATGRPEGILAQGGVGRGRERVRWTYLSSKGPELDWRLKILAKIVLSRLPVGYEIWRRAGVFVRERAQRLILVPQQHNEVSPTEVCQLSVFYGVRAVVDSRHQTA